MDCATSLKEQVIAAKAAATPLCIVGGGSKAFYGRKVQAGAELDVRQHAGIVSYEPTELVVTARCGTALAELESVLAEHGQMLPFEPPHFSGGATVGGMVAAGLSGPRRPWGGAVRDAVLGVTLLTGKGEILRFGGQVMKNVAGYDVSRLLAGSLGSLGVILEVSLRVLPRPVVEISLVQDVDATTALQRLTAWQGKPWPLTASLHDGERLWLRLSGTEAGVAAARSSLGGESETCENNMDTTLWQNVRDQRLPFFTQQQPLWRLSVPPATQALMLPGGQELVEWGGAQRWLHTDATAEQVYAAASKVGGHATLFRGHEGCGVVFQPMAAPLLALHKMLKASFDPAGIFNSGVMVEGL
jgi:glycolate oxidase FAD binding subunit